MAKNINARLVHKNDSLSNWQNATGFVPRQGEFFLVNDYEFPFIVGNGVNSAAQLCNFELISGISNSSIDTLFTGSKFFFGIATADYQAINNMTWLDWAVSDYNTQYYSIDGIYVKSISGAIVTKHDGTIVSPLDEILDSHEYLLTGLN